MKVRSLAIRTALAAGAVSGIALLAAPAGASAAHGTAGIRVPDGPATAGVIIHEGPATAGVIIDYGIRVPDGSATGPGAPWPPGPSAVTFPPGPTAVTFPPGPTAIGPEV